ncbi:hypothetical protein BDV95DRAFT_353656 [Massariosphaeria phaeospora]|uniref:Uncharacterized protein n=1 Tax=Massariosphaeria phaeospora TaxID=100035 RepID=A0A7C8MAR6_9PLEO|nr:hypothetical protein BDV95DRAFT_353656 [Massariosphaeria phaeospora]
MSKVFILLARDATVLLSLLSGILRGATGDPLSSKEMIYSLLHTLNYSVANISCCNVALFTFLLSPIRSTLEGPKTLLATYYVQICMGKWHNVPRGSMAQV